MIPGWIWIDGVEGGSSGHTYHGYDHDRTWFNIHFESQLYYGQIHIDQHHGPETWGPGPPSPVSCMMSAGYVSFSSSDGPRQTIRPVCHVHPFLDRGPWVVLNTFGPSTENQGDVKIPRDIICLICSKPMQALSWSIYANSGISKLIYLKPRRILSLIGQHQR